MQSIPTVGCSHTELGLQFQGHVVSERKHIESLCSVFWNIIAFHLATYVDRQDFFFFFSSHVLDGYLGFAKTERFNLLLKFHIQKITTCTCARVFLDSLVSPVDFLFN